MSGNVPGGGCCQLCIQSATGPHARAVQQAATQAPRGPEKGLPGAALASEEPCTLSLDDSASNRVVTSHTHAFQMTPMMCMHYKAG